MEKKADYVISVKGLTKVYKIYKKPVDRLKESLSWSRKKYSSDFYALRNIDFEVERGQIYGIMGKNGSGKSTLLKMITGVSSPTMGEISISGKISALLELGVGFNAEYTGLENIYLNGMMLGFTREEITNRLDTIIEFADIGEYIDQSVKTYSSGMFARLAFAVAINVDPDILIVDEALSVGDYFFQAKCYRKFEEFKASGKTILFVSHDLSSILKYCDKVLLLDKGQRIAEGSAHDIIDQYKKVMSSHQENMPAQQNASLQNVSRLYKEQMTINPNFSEYGTREAEIQDFGILNHLQQVSNTVIKGQNYTIYMKVLFNRKIVNPILAFTIRDAKGTDLLGTNTFLEKTDTSAVQSEEVYVCKFTQKMQMQGGNYLLSLGCTGYDMENLNVFHRLYDICMMTVVSEKNTIGYYDCESVIAFEKEENEIG